MKTVLKNPWVRLVGLLIIIFLAFRVLHAILGILIPFSLALSGAKMTDSEPPSEAQVPVEPLKCMERFKVKDFVIGSWWGPDPTEANYRAYIDAGFNVLMTYRDRANPRYGPGYQNPDKEFELAEKLGLWVLIDTYMKNETPWGGIEPDPPPDESLHHQARPAQLRWLLDRYGKSPVLAGVLLGDDCMLEDHMIESAEYMLEAAPGVFPWYAINLDTDRQAGAPLPMLSTQNYVFLIRALEPEPVKRQAYCAQLEHDSKTVDRLNMALWPWVVCVPEAGPSELRFQVNACVAYGAQGIWYYHYTDGLWDPATDRPEAKYAVARECNRYVAGIGSRLIGRRCMGVFHSPDAEQTRGETGGAAESQGERGPGKVHLGIRIGDVTPGLRTAYGIPEDVGLLVRDVDPRLSAGKAGMQKGDVMIALDGKDIVGWAQFMEMLHGRSPGDEVCLTVHREPVGRIEIRVVFDALDEVHPLTPGKDMFIRSMSDGLLAGLLVPENKMNLADARPDHVMVVDKRTVRPGEREPAEREVHVEFGPEVRSILVFTSDTTMTRTEGRRVTLRLKSGAGVLLKVNP